MKKLHLKTTFERHDIEEFTVEKSVIETLSTCSRCSGLGILVREELVNYHKNDYATFKDVCPACDGLGRVIEKESKYILLQKRNGCPVKNELVIEKTTQERIDSIR